MSNKRTFATMVALGGLIAVVALPAAVPRAKADELSDLRTNNEILQQRLKQIRQAQAASAGVGGSGGGAPAKAASGSSGPGGSFPRSFLIPGTNTSVRVGGNITETLDYRMEGGSPNAR